MCGKFTAMASWSELVDFSDAFSDTVPAGGNDQPVGFKVMGELRVIIWDAELQKRQVVPMRWGYPRRGNWRAPDPIHGLWRGPEYGARQPGSNWALRESAAKACVSP